jgi:hypothetical protein
MGHAMGFTQTNGTILQFYQFDNKKFHLNNQTEKNEQSGVSLILHGKNIYFNSGYFAPYSLTGKHLLTLNSRVSFNETVKHN